MPKKYRKKCIQKVIYRQFDIGAFRLLKWTSKVLYSVELASMRSHIIHSSKFGGRSAYLVSLDRTRCKWWCFFGGAAIWCGVWRRLWSWLPPSPLGSVCRHVCFWRHHSGNWPVYTSKQMLPFSTEAHKEMRGMASVLCSLIERSLSVNETGLSVGLSVTCWLFCRFPWLPLFFRSLLSTSQWRHFVAFFFFF